MLAVRQDEELARDKTVFILGEEVGEYQVRSSTHSFCRQKSV